MKASEFAKTKAFDPFDQPKPIEDEFISHLVAFGLTKKEAQTYLQLLRHGPKSPSALAKSLHTYREDSYRALVSLVEKGMVRPSPEAPTVYAAVDLDDALESAFKKRESDLRDIVERKRELQTLTRYQQFRTTDLVSTFKIIKDMKELVSVSLARAASIKEEHVFVFPSGALMIGALAGITEEFKTFVARGVRVRGIVDISGTDSGAETKLVQELVEAGADIRCLDQYSGLCFSVSDKKTCVSIISVDVQSVSLGAPITVIWADDKTYAHYLAANFDFLWQQAVPAAQHIKERLDDRSCALHGSA